MFLVVFGILYEGILTVTHLDQMLSFDEYFEFIGARAIREREKQWVMEAAGAVEKSNPPISA